MIKVVEKTNIEKLYNYKRKRPILRNRSFDLKRIGPPDMIVYNNVRVDNNLQELLRH